jgi:hypothetical protein
MSSNKTDKICSHYGKDLKELIVVNLKLVSFDSPGQTGGIYKTSKNLQLQDKISCPFFHYSS